MPGFVDMVNRGRKLDLIRHIDLYIEIAEYDCPLCEYEAIESEPWEEYHMAYWDPGDEEELELEAREKDYTRISDAIHRLLALLSTWKPGGSLSLDITVQSPSDSSHFYKHLDIGIGYLGLNGWQANRGGLTPRVWHDPYHGWVNGRRVALPPKASLSVLFSDIEFSAQFSQDIPFVTAVTSLVLRRQTRRRWTPSAVQEFLLLFVGLHEFHYEPWREFTPEEDQIERDIGTEHLFMLLNDADNPQLSKLVLFEDSSDDHFKTACQTDAGWVNRDPVRSAAREVSVELARAGATLPQLHHLSASFLVDAQHFLQEVPLGGSWANLVSLAITSQLLIPDQNSEVINDLLQAAAAAAMMLLQLELMELWNGRQGLAGVFRYQAPIDSAYDSRSASITWHGTWDLEIGPDVVRDWKGVACRRRLCELRVVKEILHTDTLGAAIKSHGDAILVLGLSHVLQPVSLAQILREHEALG